MKETKRYTAKRFGFINAVVDVVTVDKKELDKGDILILMALWSFADEDGTCYPSAKKIMECARYSDKKSYYNHYNGLIEKGWIVKKARLNNSNVYLLQIPDRILKLLLAKEDTGENHSEVVGKNPIGEIPSTGENHTSVSGENHTEVVGKTIHLTKQLTKHYNKTITTVADAPEKTKEQKTKDQKQKPKNHSSNTSTKSFTPHNNNPGNNKPSVGHAITLDQLETEHTFGEVYCGQDVEE